MFRLHTEVKSFDYYFFGVGIVSAINALFVLLRSFDTFFFFLLLFFYFSNFCFSILLNLVLVRKIKEIFFLDVKSYVLSHLVIAVFASISTIAILTVVEETLNFIAFFLMINFFLMFIVLASLVLGPRS